MDTRTNIALLKIAATDSAAPWADEGLSDADEAVEVAREIAAEVALDQLAAEAAAWAEYADESERDVETPAAPASSILISGQGETAL